MDHNPLIKQTEVFVKQHLQDDCTGHDWWHICRVRKLALQIGLQEGSDLFLTEIAALLHDVDDWKFEEEQAAGRVTTFLASQHVAPDLIKTIERIISEVSFKGAQVANKTTSLEAKVVQDADRIDALGAIGIARCFAYGGSRNRHIHNPDVPAQQHHSFEDYKKNQSTSINHFYEKLLLLKDRINTPTGQIIANQRHNFLQHFLDTFLQEWACQPE